MKGNPAEINAYKALTFLLKQKRIKVTDTSLQEKLKFHPEFPNLASLSDVLQEFGVTNLSTQLTTDYLSIIPLPAIAFLNIDGGIMAPIKSVSNDEVEWMHTRYGIQRESIGRFSVKWEGIVLLIEPNETSGEPNYPEKRKDEILKYLRNSILILSIIAALGLFFLHVPLIIPDAIETSIYSLLGIKLVGTAASIMLVWYGLDSSNTFLRNVCTINGKSGCNNILKTKAAKAFGLVNWSEIGMFYFLSTFLGLAVSLVTGHAAEMLQLLSVINMLAVPYVFYSIYYQGVIAQQWCILCLSVQFLLLAELQVGYQYISLNELGFNPSVVAIVATLLSVLMVGWISLKPLLASHLKLASVQKSFQRMKFNQTYVESLFSRQRYLPPFFKDMKIGHMGNPNAENTLIIVTNPTCEACANVHNEVLSVIEHSQNVRCEIILAASTASDDLSGQVAKFILSLPEEHIADALHQWFLTKHKGIDRWMANFDGYTRSEDSTEQLVRHIRWIELAGVPTTPFVFLNGIELPRTYAISEVEKLCRLSQLSRI